MSMIVTVQDDQDPYGRTGRATQREDGTWWCEYLRDGEVIGVHTLRWFDTTEAPADQDEADAALFMCEQLADPGQFGGVFPEPGYQQNRSHAVADGS